MKKMAVGLALFLLITIFMALVQASAPPSIPVQGFLADSSGTPLEGNFDAVVFSIYDVQNGGAPLWSQNIPLTIEQGLFSAYLAPMDLSLFRDHGQLWLGVQVGSDSEMDRILLGSTPFAAFAEYSGSQTPPQISDEFSAQAGPADCSAGCTQSTELGEWTFCALTSYESRLYDNVSPSLSDEWKCNLTLEAGGIWRLTAHYHAHESTRVVGYTRCGVRCFN